MAGNQEDTVDFSLVLGGPLYKFYLYTKLASKPLQLCKRRMIAICVFVWLPLLVLAIFGGVKVPFMDDINVHMRFLISLPLLIYAEVIVHERLQMIVRQFLTCDIIAPKDRPKFHASIKAVMRSTNSTITEIILLIFVITAGHWISNKYFPLNVSSWYASNVEGVVKLTPAGYWYVFVSLPVFQFLLLRWYYRLFIWYRFLRQISKLPLQLNSLHPDKAGGLGFLTNSVYAFQPLLLAHSVLLAAMVFTRIWMAGDALSQFQGEIISMMLFLIILPSAPLLFFMRDLMKTKRLGTLEYNVVASRYVNEFRKKWMGAHAKNSDDLLGTPDIQSVSDLANSFDVSAHMRVLPVSRASIVMVVILTALPFFPLVFMLMPIEKIIHQIIGIVL